MRHLAELAVVIGIHTTDLAGVCLESGAQVETCSLFVIRLSCSWSCICQPALGVSESAAGDSPLHLSHWAALDVSESMAICQRRIGAPMVRFVLRVLLIIAGFAVAVSTIHAGQQCAIQVEILL